MNTEQKFAEYWKRVRCSANMYVHSINIPLFLPSSKHKVPKRKEDQVPQETLLYLTVHVPEHIVNKGWKGSPGIAASYSCRKACDTCRYIKELFCLLLQLTQYKWIWTNSGDSGGQRSLAFCSPWGHKFSTVEFSCSFVSDSLWPHGQQHARSPCPSPTPGACSNSCPLSRWCHPTISSSVVPISYPLQSFSTSGSFPMSQFFTPGDQSIGVSASTSILPMNIQDWFPLGLTGWISLLSKGLSRVFSNTTVQKHQFLYAQLSL